MIAYSRLNALEPEAYNVQAFYRHVSKNFNDIITLMNLAAEKSSADKDQPWLIINRSA